MRELKRMILKGKKKGKTWKKRGGGGIEEIYILIITNTNNLISTEKYTENKTM